MTGVVALQRLRGIRFVVWLLVCAFGALQLVTRRTRPQLDRAAVGPPERITPVERERHLPAIAVWLGFAAGCLMLAYSYSYASTHQADDRVHFHLFWLAELLFLVPALVRLFQQSTTRASRLAIVVAIAAFDYAPKYLRDPHFPLFHDELVHSHQVASIASAGQVFEPSPLIGIIRFFPGLHGAAASLEKLTGASPFLVQSLLMLILHVLALVGIFLIAEQLSRSARVGGLAAFAYSLNPSFLFFDSQFAYESLAIVLFIWVLVAVVKAEAASEARRRAGWLAIAFVLGAACVVTHHITSYALTLMLALTALVALVRVPRRREARANAAGLAALVQRDLVALPAVVTLARTRRKREARANAAGLVALAIAVAGAAAAWLLLIAGDVLPYLSPHVSGGVHQVLSLIQHEQRSRTLFVASHTPMYEHWAAFLSPVIGFAGALAGIWCLWLRRMRSAIPRTLVVLGFLYFASLPFIYTQAGNEGARRSWSISYIGLSILLAFAVNDLTRRSRARGKVVAAVASALTLIVLGVLYVGNVGSGVNEYYRFPGPPNVRSEVRTLTPEVRSAASWLDRTQGPGRKVVADQYDGPPLAFFGRATPATPSAGFPTWELYLSRNPIAPALANQLQSSRYDYLFVNGTLPLVPSYYQTQTASSGPEGEWTGSAKSRSSSVIARYDRLPWAVKLYGSDNLAIYRLDFSRARNGAHP